MLVTRWTIFLWPFSRAPEHGVTHLLSTRHLFTWACCPLFLAVNIFIWIPLTKSLEQPTLPSPHKQTQTNKHKQTNKNAHWTWRVEEYWGKSTSQAQMSPISELNHYGWIQTCSSWARLRFNRACPRLILLSTSAIMFWRYLRNSSSYLTFLNRGLSWYLVRLKGKRRSLHMYTVCELKGWEHNRLISNFRAFFHVAENCLNFCMWPSLHS